MKVSEFIEFMKNVDQDAEVEIICCDESGVSFSQSFDPEKHFEYTDFRGNPFVKPEDSWFDKRYVQIGSGV